MKLIVAVAAGLLLATTCPSHAGVDQALLCKEKKAKATGKKAFDLLKAFGKNTKIPNPPKLSSDISKAQSKFTKGFTKAESNGLCLTSEDSDTVEAKVDAFVDDIVGGVTTVERCGDGAVNQPSEECDGTDDAACNAGPCLPDCTCECDCCTTGLDLLSFTTGLASGNSGALRNFRCSNDVNAACADNGDCDFGTCLSIGPDICSDRTTLTCTTSTDCVGTCQEIVAGVYPKTLLTGGLYTGGGQNTVPLPLGVPDRGQSFTKVTDCTGDILELGPTTPAEVGTERACTTGRQCSVSGTTCVIDSDCPGVETCQTRCWFGPPLPIQNSNIPPTSLCVIRHVAEDASGTAQCRGGSMTVNIPLRWVVHLGGDLFNLSTPPDIPGVQPCPLCDTLCQGGDNNRFPCDPDFPNCPGGGTCGGSPECLGGPNNGQACTPETSGVDLLGSAFPTSHDCPPNPLQDITASIGGLPVAFALTSGSITLDAVDHPGGNRVFTGFCRDVFVEGSLCFDGDWDGSCPDSVAQPTCLPDSGLTSGCGNAIPCDSDADCTAPYESCAQRSSGAFSLAESTRIDVVGSTDGQCLADGQPHPIDLVSIFAIPPTFDPTVDAAGDLPGPGAELPGGAIQLQ